MNPPSDPGYAGDMFAYNFGFFFPMLGFSSIVGMIAIIYLIRFIRDLEDYEIKHKKLRIFIVSVLLFPMLIHLIPLLVLILMPVD